MKTNYKLLDKILAFGYFVNEHPFKDPRIVNLEEPICYCGRMFYIDEICNEVRVSSLYWYFNWWSNSTVCQISIETFIKLISNKAKFDLFIDNLPDDVERTESKVKLKPVRMRTKSIKHLHGNAI